MLPYKPSKCFKSSIFARKIGLCAEKIAYNHIHQRLMLSTNLIALYQENFRKHWERPAIANYEGQSYLTAELATEIAKLHLLFEHCGIAPGDKVAVMGKDTAEWVISFMATITYGAVIVPILQDFAPADAMSIIKHSEAKLIFINHGLWANLRPEEMPELRYAMGIQHRTELYTQPGQPSLAELLEALPQSFAAKYPKGYAREDVAYHLTPNDRLLLLNYTSGTTGMSKGVMVTGNNIAGNILWCNEHNIIRPGDRLLSFLPLAHTYGCMINLFLALMTGTYVTYLGKAPSPTVLRAAFRAVRPSIIVSVPLVIEKIYLNAIAPQLKEPKVKLLLSIPFIKNIIHKKIRQKLLEGMGGEARMVIVGGAALNPEIGAFLKKIGFPIVVGYGMTECAPLISFTPDPKAWRLGSCGQTLKGYMQVRIAPAEDEQGNLIERQDEQGRPIGEIQTRGENTCLGYYKNDEATQALFTEDGWLRTGDLGSMDEAGFIYIKGRSKTMILGASGQNIYPEEIEAKISLLPYVQESVVLMRNTRLEALIYLNEAAIETAGITPEQAWEELLAQRAELNKQLGSYEQIQRFERHAEPFAKTPKQSIKRFLYK